jgi:myosin-1
VEAPRVGVLSILDEACATIGNVTDEMFLGELDRQLSQHKYFDSKLKNHTDKVMSFKQHFRVTHYAGDVVYSVKGFIGSVLGIK